MHRRPNRQRFQIQSAIRLEIAAVRIVAMSVASSTLSDLEASVVVSSLALYDLRLQ